MSKPIVAIVGRPNVGKSTLFNVLAGDNISIVKDTPGVTRDRIYADVEWLNHKFTLVDTGGIEPESKDIILSQMRDQAQIAIDTANVIIFITDVRQGLVDADAKVADMLRRSRKPVVLVVNKVDNFDRQMMDVYEFYNLGIGEPHAISASGKLGIGDMLDEVTGYFDPEMENEEESEIPRIAIVGKPNVGKSSLVNKLLGSNRVIVSDIAGTTRDSIYTRYNKFGFDFYLVDTAGIRKKNKVHEDIEYYSVIRSIRAIEASDVCILMIDATRGIEAQDQAIFGLIQRNKKGLVVCVNKWDLVEDKSNEAIHHFEEAIRARFAPFTDFPIIFASALTKQRIHRVLETAVKVYENRRRTVPTSVLNKVMLEAVAAYPPPANKGKYIKIKYVTMLKGSPVPTFIFFCNLPQWVKEPYRRYLENKIRENWDFCGTPIQVFMREK